MNQTKPDIDAEFFALMENLEIPECESGHYAHDNKKCSHTVVAKKYVACTGRVLNVCLLSAAWNYSMISSPSVDCASSGNTCYRCWRIEPI